MFFPRLLSSEPPPQVSETADPCIRAVIDVQRALGPLTDAQRQIVLEFVVKNLEANHEIERHRKPFHFED